MEATEADAKSKKKCFNNFLVFILKIIHHFAKTFSSEIDMCQNRRSRLFFLHFSTFCSSLQYLSPIPPEKKVLETRCFSFISFHPTLSSSLCSRRKCDTLITENKKANPEQQSKAKICVIERNMTSIRFTDHHVIYCLLIFVFFFQIGLSTIFLSLPFSKQPQNSINIHAVGFQI